MPSSQVRCRVLGACVIEVDDARLTPELELVYALALYLCVHRGRGVKRDHVARLLWPDQDLESARHCLRQLMYRLRSAGIPARTRGANLVVDGAEIDLDFEPLIEGEPSRDIYLQHDRFDVLPDYAPMVSKLYRHWVDEYRAEVAMRIRTGLVRCVADARSRGRYREVEVLAKHCLALDPLNEEATLGLAEATVLQGNKLRALQILDAFHAEIGVRSPELRIQSGLLRKRIAERHNVYNVRSDELPMVGRDEQLEYLVRMMHEVRRGESRSVLITGEPGIGKTRLTTEFSKIAQLHGMQVVTINCQPGWAEQPLIAITEFAQQMLALPGAIGCSPEALRAVNHLVGVIDSSNHRVLNNLDAAESGLSTIRWSLTELAEAVLSECALIFAVDNVQWLDEPSASVFAHIRGHCSRRRLMLLMTARETNSTRNAAVVSPSFESASIRLRPLTDNFSRQLALAIADRADRSTSGRYAEACVSRSGGNPYFLSELARFFLLEGVDAAAPTSLKHFLEQRIEGLAVLSRRALRACAVLGPHATLPRLSKILRLNLFAIAEAVDDLEQGGLVSVDGDRCICRHDVVREIVLHLLPTVAHRLLYIRAARTLRVEGEENRDPALLFACGQLLIHSQDAERAASGAIWLSTRLLRLGAANEAWQLSKAAFLQASTQGRQRSASIVRVLAARALGRWGEVRQGFVELDQLQVPGVARNPHSVLELLRAESQYAELAENARVDHTIVNCVTAANASNTHRSAAARIAMIVADNAADGASAAKTLQACSSIALTAVQSRVDIATTRMIYALAFGNTTDTDEQAHILLENAPRLHSRVEEIRVLRRAALGCIRSGDSETADRALQRAERLASVFGLFSEHFFSLEAMFELHIHQGELARAGETLEQARALAAQHPVDGRLAFVTFVLTIQLALERGLPAVVDPAQVSIVRAAFATQLARPSQCLLACLTYLDLRNSQCEVAHDNISQLLELYELLGARGHQDFPTSVLVRALMSIGEREKATSLHSRFIETDRRDRSPMLGSLRSLRTELMLPAIR